MKKVKAFFAKIREFTKKHKKLTIFIIIILVLLCLVLYVRSQLKKASEMLAQMTASEISQVERRSLVESLSATGAVVSVDSIDITANVTGVEVLEVLVNEGDFVKAGDVLCLLDSEDLEINLNNAKKALDVTDQKSDANVAIAKRAMSEAITNEEVQVERDYEDAQELYDDYIKALEEYDQAKMEYDSAVDFYEFRLKEYNDYREEYKDLDEYEFLNRTERGAFYKSNLTAAENDKNAKKSALDNKEKAAENALNNYENLIRSYEDHIRNNDSNVKSKNDNVKNASLDDETATLSTEQQVKQLQDQVDACTIVAPMDGIVTSVKVSEGNMYTGTAVLTLEDVSAFEVTAQIDEYDIAKVKVGQRVIIKTNGTGDLELDGIVKEVAPRATNTAGTTNTSVTYKVTISVLTPCDDLKMDMTAKISIIIDEKENVLTVPYDAVQTDDEGNFYIEVTDSNSENASAGLGQDNKRIYVTKGIESDYYIEVFGDGIVEGISVIVPNANSSMNDFMNMMMEQGAMGGF